MFTHTPKGKLASNITPHLDHNYWKERVYKENELKQQRTDVDLGKFSLIRNYRNASLNDKCKNKVFSENTASLFTDYINSKVKVDFQVPVARVIKPATAVNWTRINNGGHIPRFSTETPTGYLAKFAKNSYIKPHQLYEDSNEVDNIIDDIKTDPRNTFSKKKKLINRLLKNN